jgi:hypothetical protein
MGTGAAPAELEERAAAALAAAPALADLEAHTLWRQVGGCAG